MIQFLESAYFLGFILMALSGALFFAVFLPSWYVGHPRRFWITRLTYPDDQDQQQFVRFVWLLAWVIALVGSFIAACNHPKMPHTLNLILGQAVYNVIVIWLVAKLSLVFCIIVRYVWLVFVWIKDWVQHDKSLFKTIRRQC